MHEDKELVTIRQKLFDMGMYFQELAQVSSNGQIRKIHKKMYKAMNKIDKLVTDFTEKNPNYEVLNNEDKYLCKYIYELSGNIMYNRENLRNSIKDMPELLDFQTHKLMLIFGVPSEMQYRSLEY